MSTHEDKFSDRYIESYLDKPGFINRDDAVRMLLAIEVDSERYLVTPKRYVVYCNLRDSIELSNGFNGGANLN